MKKLLVLLTFVLLLFAFAIPTAAESQETPVSYEGFAARLKGNATAIRSLYTVDMDKVAALESEGYEVHIGAVMGVAEYKGVKVHEVSDLLVSYGLRVRTRPISSTAAARCSSRIAFLKISLTTP